jgi:hypothetical protein
MARLDRLGPAKDVAQIGAAIGREYLARLIGCGGKEARSRVGSGTRPSPCRRFALPRGRSAARDLPVQACPGAGHGLWHAAVRAAPGTARPNCGNPRKPLPGHR